MKLSADLIACAVVAAARGCGEDPREFFPVDSARGMRCRYYAARLLMRWRGHRIDITNPMIGQAVGYSIKSAGVTLSPSSRPKGFSGYTFDQMWQSFCALVECYAPDVYQATSMSAPVHALPPPQPRPAPRPAPMITPSPGVPAEKRALREMIADAFANTPGAKPVSDRTIDK